MVAENINSTQQGSKSVKAGATVVLDEKMNKKDNTIIVKEVRSITIYVILSFLFVLIIFLAAFCIAFVNQCTNNEAFRSYLRDEETRMEIQSIVTRFLSQSHESTPIQKPYDTIETVRNERKHLPNIVRERREAGSYYGNKFLQNIQEDAPTPEVEFFNPKIRSELERKDAEIIKKTGMKGAAPGGDEWVWMTSHSRVPYNAIVGFCKATKEYCPPGPPGLPGVPGMKGYRGDVGLPGPPGFAGRDGFAGPKGPKGDPGIPGNLGLDGRDGLPGEPGLDGVPGRAGADGIPGKDGKDGIPGIDGRNGENGKDGSTGMTGPQGPLGLQGPKGIAGPRGHRGKSGINGVPGIPGINAYKITVNGTLSSELLIPPSIGDVRTLEKPIVVEEGYHLRLSCGANGNPRPSVQWRREDGKTIAVGAWEASSISGHQLNLTKINREHMGVYRCVADNGIPPKANASFYVEVHFAPLIKVSNQVIYASIGSTASVECDIEAFPEALKYWERDDGRLLDPGDKYRMETRTEGYKSMMRLNITKVTTSDMGKYHCISKNEKGVTKGVAFVKDRKYAYQSKDRTDQIAVFGNTAPDKISYEDLCPPIPACPECQDRRETKCKDTLVSLFDLVGNMVIKPTDNVTYTGRLNRTQDCVLYAVGKPVYHKFIEQNYGSWLKDPLPRSNATAEKIWATKENNYQTLFEYANKAVFRNNIPTKEYRIDPSFRGNANVVYNGSFYYNQRDRTNIVKYDLNSETKMYSEPLVGAISNGSNYLYTTEYNFMDLNVDDNGLWVIYNTQESNNTIIAKMDSYNLRIEYSWNVSINHHKVGEMFIVCGVLYAIDSVNEKTTKIRLALDLYREVLLDVDLSFSNPFKKTTTVGYNHRNTELYTWDKGNQLTYPIRYHKMEYNSTSSEKTDEGLDEHIKTEYQH